MKSKDLNFEYIEEFVDYLVEKIEDDDELFATVVCKFDEAREIIKYLMMFDDIDFENICLESPDEKGYTDEFCIELWYNDGVVNFSCNPLKVNGKYENPCGDETYLFDDCSSKIIPLCEGSRLYFVSIKDDCDCESSCDCRKKGATVEYSDGADGKLHGFTASKVDDNNYQSFSFYTSEKLNESNIRYLLEEFGF